MKLTDFHDLIEMHSEYLLPGERRIIIIIIIISYISPLSFLGIQSTILFLGYGVSRYRWID